ncbi:Olfactory receptor 2M5, partial [Mesitornis unicolor]
LYNPMYFFLLNLFVLDLECVSTPIPKAMANSLWDTREISYMGCAARVFFFLCFISAEYFLLFVMACNCYVAICKLLHYRTLLGSRACVHMAAVLSYVQIFRAVLRIPSEQGRHKAFSMCLPHLAMVSLFVSTGFFAYVESPSVSIPVLNLLLSLLYSVVSPAVYPFTYSLRNQQIKDALKRLL